jgi:alpha-L-arabinofuranosidase
VVVGDAAALTGSDPAAANSESDQQRVVPASLEVTGHEGLLTVELPAVSWAYVRLDTA